MRVSLGWCLWWLLGAYALASDGGLYSESAGVDWVPWSPAVLERAQREHRLVFLDLTADWCQFCKKMDATTYRAPQVIDRIGRDYIAVRVDDKDRSELGRRYAGTGRPGTVVLDADGNELIVKVGYLQPQWMVWLLEAVSAEQAVALRDANE